MRTAGLSLPKPRRLPSGAVNRTPLAMQRRDFLLSATAATLASPALAAPAKRRMRIALVPGSIGVNVNSQRDSIELAHRHGFEAVEPRATELAAAPASEVETLRGELTAKGLTWAATSLSVDFRKDDATFRQGLAALPARAERPGAPPIVIRNARIFDGLSAQLRPGSLLIADRQIRRIAAGAITRLSRTGSRRSASIATPPTSVSPRASTRQSSRPRCPSSRAASSGSCSRT